MTLQQWIDGLVQSRYKTTRALAVAIGMTESGFSRAVKAGTFDVENCLKLAQETGESARTVLAMAGKADVNSLIEQLYGEPHPPKNAHAVKAYDLMAAIEDAEAREGFVMMMRGYLKAQTQATTEAATSTPAPRRR